MIFKKKKDNLDQEVQNLTKLVKINSIINSTLDIVRLLTIIMEIIKDIMDAEASTLLLFEEGSKDLVFKVALGEAGKELTERYRVKIGQGIAGWVAETRMSIYVNDAYSDKRFDPEFDKKTGFTTKSIMGTPLLFKGKLIGVIEAINPLNKEGFDDEDMNLFKVFANQAALAVQNAIFFQNAIEEARIKSELTSAKSAQESLIPDIDKKFDNIHIAAKSISAREISGEFHSLFQLDDNNIGIALGDIHEKGIAGGFHASIVSGALRALARVKGKNPSELIALLNSSVSENLKNMNNVSIFYGLFNIQDRNLQFINAGIAYPILIRDRVARYLRIGKRNLAKKDDNDKRVLVKLRPDDFFVILSDGILRIKNSSGKQLGLKSIMSFLEGRFAGPDYIVDSLIDFATEFSGKIGSKEDISIIAMKVK